MYDFKQMSGRKWRHEATGVTVSMDEDKKTWSIRTIDGLCLLLTATAQPRRFRSLAQALQNGRVIVDRMNNEPLYA